MLNPMINGLAHGPINGLRLSWQCDGTRFERVFTDPREGIAGLIAAFLTDGVTLLAVQPVDVYEVHFFYPNGHWDTTNVFAAGDADALDRAAPDVAPGWTEAHSAAPGGDRKVLHLL